MRVRTTLTGTSPYVQHNVQLADADNVWTKEISKFTSKRKKTEEDRAVIARLEFMGGLYVDEDGPFVPTANLRRCIATTATVRRLGKAVERAVMPVDLKVPIVYEGPKTVQALWDDPKFRYSTPVGIGPKRVVRTRPWFPTWTVEAEWELVTDALDLEDFQSILALAGIIEGLGDNRRNGYGRFSAEVTVL